MLIGPRWESGYLFIYDHSLGTHSLTLVTSTAEGAIDVLRRCHRHHCKQRRHSLLIHSIAKNSATHGAIAIART